MKSQANILWKVAAGGANTSVATVVLYDHTWDHIRDGHPEIGPLFDKVKATIEDPSAIYDSNTNPGNAVLFFNDAVSDGNGQILAVPVLIKTPSLVTTACYRWPNYTGALLWKR